MMEFLLLFMRLILGGVFAYSGYSKLIAPVQNFVAAIEAYQFLNPPFIYPIASILPWLELTFGVFLFLGFLTRLSASLLNVFSITFVTLLTRSIILKLPISECGCFGSGISLAPHQALLLDIGLFFLAVCLSIFSSRLLSLDKRLSQ